MVNKLTVLFPFLADYHAELHLAHIARSLNEPHPTVRLHLNALVEEGFLQRRRVGTLTLYKLNTSNPLLLDLLVQAEKERLLKAPLLVRALTEDVRKQLGDRSLALLFGSIVDQPNAANDIDLFLLGDDDVTISPRYRRPLHSTKVSGLDRTPSALKAEIMKKHLFLQGTEQLVRWLLW